MSGAESANFRRMAIRRKSSPTLHSSALVFAGPPGGGRLCPPPGEGARKEAAGNVTEDFAKTAPLSCYVCQCRRLVRWVWS
ncbi:hypothetical protein KIL84_019938, partial [Mauremys mutica]